MDDFKRLYQADNTRLSLQDGKGRTAAHQAAARNRVNILRYIRDQNGGNLKSLQVFQINHHKNLENVSNFYSFRFCYIDFNIRDNAGNTPLHMAVELDSYDALDFLLSV